MHHLGERGLSGARLTLDQDGRLPSSLAKLMKQLLHLVANSPHRWAVPDQLRQRCHARVLITVSRRLFGMWHAPLVGAAILAGVQATRRSFDTGEAGQSRVTDNCPSIKED